MNDIRIMKQSDIKTCPNCIMVFNHYRENGTCKCDDPNETEMASWGYVWDDKVKQWIVPIEA